MLVLGTTITVKQIRTPTDPSAANNLPRSLGPLIARLDALKLTRLYANYWIAYRLDFATDERIVAVEANFDALGLRNGRVLPPSLGPGDARQPKYDAIVRPARHGYVFLRTTAAQLGIAGLLTTHGYVAENVGRFVIYVPTSRNA
jgi:hypothetical protein